MQIPTSRFRVARNSQDLFGSAISVKCAPCATPDPARHVAGVVQPFCRSRPRTRQPHPVIQAAVDDGSRTSPTGHDRTQAHPRFGHVLPPTAQLLLPHGLDDEDRQGAARLGSITAPRVAVRSTEIVCTLLRTANRGLAGGRRRMRPQVRPMRPRAGPQAGRCDLM